MRNLFASTLLCASLMLALSCAARAQQQPPEIKEEEIIATFKGVDGKTYDLAEMRGNVLLVSFGATWCAPCAQEVEALEQLKKEYEGRPVRFFWVSIDEEKQISNRDLRGYAKRRKLTLPVLRDPVRMVYDHFSTLVRLPLVVFFDKEGYVDTPHHVGMTTPELYKTKMRQRLDKLLAAEPNVNSTTAK